VRTRSVSNELLKIQYRNKFRNSVDLCIAFNEKQFYINAKGADNYGGKGFIDFGLTKRARKKVEFYIKENNSL